MWTMVCWAMLGGAWYVDHGMLGNARWVMVGGHGRGWGMVCGPWYVCHGRGHCRAWDIVGRGAW